MRIDKRYLNAALVWLVGVIIIYNFYSHSMKIEDLVAQSIVNSDNGLLVLASAWQVFYVVIFALPFFSGAFFLPRWAIIPAWVLAIIMILLFIPSAEPVPLVLTGLIGFALLYPLHEQKLGILAAFLVFLQLLLGLQWLSFFSGSEYVYLGITDVTRDIKIAADYTGGLPVLNVVSIFLGGAFTLLAIFSSRLFVVYNHSISEAERRKREDLAMQGMHMQAVESRMLQEMHSLVHDLKTPLMTVQGLNSLIEMANPDLKTQEYCKKISSAVDKVNEMVSEILYDEVRKEVQVDEFIKYMRAHVLVKFQGQIVNVALAEDLPAISINLIRMARVFANLMQNAFTATAGVKDGLITIHVRQIDENVCFAICDNGIGIAKENLEIIWNHGFSTKNSSGLGLNFVKKVIENHKGTVEISSEQGKGTTVQILLPGVKNG